MTLSGKAKGASLQLSDFLVQVAEAVAANIVAAVLYRFGKFIRRRISYPLTLFLFDCFRGLSAVSFITMVLYPRLEKSRLSFLFPVVRFYARGFLRIVWVSLSPRSIGVLSRIFQHNLMVRSYAMSEATRYSRALADLFSAQDDDLSSLSTFIFSLLFRAASKSVVESDGLLENKLRQTREDLLAQLGP
jgi:hypothetical protein